MFLPLNLIVGHIHYKIKNNIVKWIIQRITFAAFYVINTDTTGMDTKSFENKYTYV